MNIDRNSPLPFYYQLKQILVEQIENHRWQPGDMLPTELQLQEQYDVSRTTVRQALRELELEGKVTRYRGRGTFVAEPKISHSPTQHPSLVDYLRERGMTPGWKLLFAGYVPAPHDVAAQFNIETDTMVFQLRRLRLADDEPIGHHTAYVAPDFANTIDESSFSTGGSLRYLRHILNGGIANRILEASIANKEDCDLLDVEKGAAMFIIRRTVMTADGKPVEVFRGVYRADRFQYHINNMQAINPINE
ncbi:MAG: GntR family transcriptional regulator [Chloroflexi bacterium]|nr:MAG: GntR family transcriptional regulator [Chloroflexota bacterium]